MFKVFFIGFVLAAILLALMTYFRRNRLKADDRAYLTTMVGATAVLFLWSWMMGGVIIQAIMR